MSTKIKTLTGWKTVADCGAAAPYSYSTNEQKTGGYWIDGKPIYRKVFTGLSVTVGSGSNWTHAAQLSNVENLVNFIPYTNNTSIWQGALLARVDSGYIDVYPASGLNVTISRIVAEYTKTGE